jgi:hypothetical protein
MSWLWPPRTGQTFLDLWSVCHLCFWIVIGFNWGALALKNKALHPVWLPIVVTVCGALLWEVFEWQVLERLGIVRHPELWFNRWLSDPLVGVIGVLLGIWLVRHQ